MGTCQWPPDISCTFAAWLTIWSMVRVTKSPNMISTTGRRPVMAAPTAIPVKPASEIGVSSTRSGPNSSTSPVKTLNGWPASAMSSPITRTRESRRSSSARASRTACASVISRTLFSGIHVLLNFIHRGIGRGDGELNGLIDPGFHFGLDGVESRPVGHLLFDEPIAQDLDGIALGLPLLLFLLGPVIIAAYVADVMAVIPVRIHKQESRTFAFPRPLHQALGGGVDGPYILPIDAFRVNAEGLPARQDVAGGDFGEMRVLVVHVVLADVDHRQLPDRGHVHDLVERPLSQRAFSEETDRNAPIAEPLGRKCSAGGDAGAASHDRVRAQVAGRGIGDVHRSALAFAVPGLFAQQFGEHPVGRRPFREAVSMAAMGAGDVIVGPQCRADADRHRLFSDV